MKTGDQTTCLTMARLEMRFEGTSKPRTLDGRESVESWRFSEACERAAEPRLKAAGLMFFHSQVPHSTIFA